MSKFTPYIISENFSRLSPYKEFTTQFTTQKICFSKEEPYIQNAIDNKHYESVYWLVENGATWKESLRYYANEDNVLNYIYWLQKFTEDSNDAKELNKLARYFETL